MLQQQWIDQSRRGVTTVLAIFMSCVHLQCIQQHLIKTGGRLVVVWAFVVWKPSDAIVTFIVTFCPLTLPQDHMMCIKMMPSHALSILV